MDNFTPESALIGGVIIGLSVVLYFYTTGRLAGISGIFENAISNTSKRLSNILFLIGLVIGPMIIYYIISPNEQIAFNITNSYFLIISGGFWLVLEQGLEVVALLVMVYVELEDFQQALLLQPVFLF